MNEGDHPNMQAQPEEATSSTPDQQAPAPTAEDLAPPESSSPVEQFDFYMQRADKSRQGGDLSAAQAAMEEAGKVLEESPGDFDLTHFIDFDELSDEITQRDEQQEESASAPENRRSRLAGMFDRARSIVDQQRSRLQGDGSKRILEMGEQKLKLVHGKAAGAYDAAAGKFDRGIKGLSNNFEIAKLYIQIIKHERNLGRLEAMKTKASARIDELQKQYSERQQSIKDSYRKESETQSYFEEAERLRNLAEAATLPGYSETLVNMAEHLEKLGNNAVEVAANQELKDLNTETTDIWRELKGNLDFYTEQAEQLEDQIGDLRNEAQTHLNNATNLQKFVQRIREATGKNEAAEAIPVVPDVATTEAATAEEATASTANENEEQPPSRSSRLRELRERFFPIKN